MAAEGLPVEVCCRVLGVSVSGYYRWLIARPSEREIPFWSRMQFELLDRRRWKTRLELANAIFDYIEIFYNRQRRHSALGMRTPVEFENAPTEPITAA